MKKAILLILTAVISQLFFACGVKAENSSSAASSSSSGEGYSVPIIRYGSITTDDSLIGENTCTLSQLESDIISLSESGFSPVFINDIIRYVKYDGILPDRPIIMIIDETKLNCLSDLLPLAQKYNWRFTATISGSKTDGASEDAAPSSERSYLCWEDISALRNSGTFEFAAAAYDILSDPERENGGIKQDEDIRTYRRAYLADVLGLRERCYDNCLFKPNSFILPTGTLSDEFLTLAKECAFDAYITDESGITAIKKGDSSCLHKLKRIDRSGYFDTDDLLAQMG
ncbi:MAG: hypothetical protein IJ571_07055 [Ruminococcus sp.]|nr:hypothetical protein [Ruminococcus sp.]